MSDSTAQLAMVYDGPELETGSMDVRDLAPAMLSVGSFFEKANQLLNGNRAAVTVNVRATSPGSFDILFEVVQNTDILNTPSADIGDLISQANEIKQFLIGGGAGGAGGGGGIGLIALIKKLRGRGNRFEKINESTCRITIDGETYEFPLQLIRLYQDTVIRRNIEDMVKPIKSEGIDRLRFRQDRRTIQEITEDEAEYFDSSRDDGLLMDEISEKHFSIVSLAFKQDNKWRLTDGQSVLSVRITDEEFLSRVDDGSVAFAKNDTLRCRLRTIQWQSDSGIRSEYEIVKVLEHITAPRMDFDG